MIPRTIQTTEIKPELQRIVVESTNKTLLLALVDFLANFPGCSPADTKVIFQSSPKIGG